MMNIQVKWLQTHCLLFNILLLNTVGLRRETGLELSLCSFSMGMKTCVFYISYHVFFSPVWQVAKSWPTHWGDSPAVERVVVGICFHLSPVCSSWHGSDQRHDQRFSLSQVNLILFGLFTPHLQKVRMHKNCFDVHV